MSASSPDRFIRFAAWLLTGATLPVFLAELPPLWLLIVSACAVSALAARFAWLRSGLFLLLGFTWVCWHASSSIDRVMSPELEKQPMLVIGRVVDLPQREADRLKIPLRVEESYPHQAFADSGKLILNCYRCTIDIRAGERWQFRVKLKRPSGGVSPGAFDYEKWLFRHRVAATGYLVSGETGQADNGNRRLEPAGRLYYQVWRTDLQTWIQSLDGLSPRASGLFRALLIGDRSGLSNVDWHVLRSTGVAHLVAISGLHIGLIMVTIMFLARHIFDFVPRLYLLCPRIWITRCLGLLGATGYAALAGFAVPTLRALLMIGLFILAHFLGRNISLFRLLFATVFILLLLDPFIAFDTGFWLSFGAVFIIAWSSSGVGSMNWLMAQPRLWLGMMPLLVLFFSHVSLVAPVANFVAIPVVSFLLLPAGLLASLLAGLGLDKPGALLLEYSGQVADAGLTGLEFLADIPMASLSYTPTGSVSAALIIVTGLMMTTPFQFHSPAIYLVMAVLAFLPAPALLQRGEFEVALLDVGQGLSIVITTRHTTTVYDTGPRYGPGFNAGEAIVLPYLRSGSLSSVDMLVVSHGDNDHIGGAEALLHARPVDRILTSVPERLPRSEPCVAGDNWVFDDVIFNVLGPDSQTPRGSNNRSCVIRINGNGGSILLTGDIEKEVEIDLVSRALPGSLQADVLLVPHQGSRTSSRPVFVEQVSPRLALVASGYLNSYGHPHAEVLARYLDRDVTVLNTADSGTITVTFLREGISWTEYRESHRRFWYRRRSPR